MSTSEAIVQLEDTHGRPAFAQAIRDAACREIDTFAGEKNGRFETHELVDFARDKHGTALYRLFAFDRPDKDVAEAWRLAQARHLIAFRKHVAHVKDERALPPQRVLAVQLRSYVHRHGETGYATRDSVLGDEEARARLVEFARCELRSWCARYADMDECQPFREAISALLIDATCLSARLGLAQAGPGESSQAR